ncbi:N-acetylglucosaminyl-phosphatidylinositol de-N-acetylase isoform X2 [Mixophyes fleayi]|uniref:N-acetylglucosaminyl-phosphatidylinositol de-N-acetylase isoform X2 n=1 Tax=Mixophyes fleayi TaxID=3061075 RepID=UPI003F4D83D9
MLAVAVVVVISLLWYACSRWRDALCDRAVGLLPGVRAPLLLIAHPDDECMFFAPSILGLLQEQRPLSVLCCTTGNYYNQGEIRKKELIQSCAVLGVPISNVTLIDHSDLPDHPSTPWDQVLLSSLIINHIQEKNIDLVITFDERGVSGHSNHISLYNAVSPIMSLGNPRVGRFIEQAEAHVAAQDGNSCQPIQSQQLVHHCWTREHVFRPCVSLFGMSDAEVVRRYRLPPHVILDTLRFMLCIVT